MNVFTVVVVVIIAEWTDGWLVGLVLIYLSAALWRATYFSHKTQQNVVVKVGRSGRRPIVFSNKMMTKLTTRQTTTLMLKQTDDDAVPFMM